MGQSYGSYLSLVYPSGREVANTNSTNGVRPVIKLKYTIKLKKIDSSSNTSWQILEN